jgi:ATP-dependent RNA helicase SUPV3L1/SUV3
MPDSSLITALLGPTNTGKTHRAVERMLEHESGMMGLPLRLLAREVYDRVTTRLGEGRVALVTGEEKRVPKHAKYWICTVEAMPMDREVDFLAVDEIQLAADEQRGHVFTDRLLRARGRRETWFMGAATMRPLVRELVPTARLADHPRLSRLTSAGAEKLQRLPPRSAVVVFSTTQVYEIAERLRALRGGAAVVLGALSPRTRNAQVAMFQAGEVDYLVATDAIGMGLNLDVKHVAFAALRKFDGRDVRELDAAELAQIAGRAGRHLADGTFGTVAPLALPDGVAAAIEAHHFPAVRRLVWRRGDVDTSSLEALRASLKERPRVRSLRLVEEAEDTLALERLAEDPEVRARARGGGGVELLWDVCRVPDFRKLLFESHVALLRELYAQLGGPREALDPDWMASRVAEIDDVDGDIEALITRISSIRTWTYISNHTRWVADATAWQERTRAIEDRLSDALHDRLVARFAPRSGEAAVSAPKGRPARGGKAADAPKKPDPSHPFAALLALRGALAPEPAHPDRDAERWVEALVTAPHDALGVDASGRVAWGDRVVGRLVRGPGLLAPEVKLAGLDALGAGARSRVTRRLVAFARDLVEELLAPLRGKRARELTAAGRGVVYQLEQGLGTALAEGAAGQLAELTAADREHLAAMGVALGELAVYLPALLKPRAIEQRLALLFAAHDGRALPPLPRPGAVSMAAQREVEPRLYASIGYVPLGPRAVRADVAERVRADLAAGAPGQLAGRLGCSSKELPLVKRALLGDPSGEAEGEA